MTSALGTVARLLFDIASMTLFVWLLGTDGELLDSHLFFYVRYTEFAEVLAELGRFREADKSRELAEAHFHLAPDDDDPPAVAMAMPVPEPTMRTNAVSTKTVKPTVSDDVSLSSCSQRCDGPRPLM
jgi:hypothetical protein